MIRVLALDIAFRTGYALTGGPSGVVDFRGDVDDYGRLAWRWSRWLADMLAEYQPDLMVTELALFRGASSYPLTGMAWDAHKMAYAHQVPRREVTPDTWRKALGMPCRGKAEVLKAASLVRTKALGLAPVDDNHADALCILEWAERQYGQEVA